MAAIRCCHIIFVFLAISFLPAGGRVRLQSNNGDVHERYDGTFDMEILENSAIPDDDTPNRPSDTRVDDTHGLPDAIRVDETLDLPSDIRVDETHVLPDAIHVDETNALPDTLRVDETHDLPYVLRVEETYDLPEEATDIYPPPSDLETERRSGDLFQGCMVECIDADLCCSCKASGRKSMVAAMVNQLTAECASTDITDCAGKWVHSNLEPNQRGQASNCTRPDTVARNVQQCASQCVGRPLSKPLNPNYPSYNPGRARNLDDVSNLPSIDLTDFCEDIRAEGFFCTTYRADCFTAGNTLCRPNMRCGSHGYKYSWCYVDYSNEWDYCCTGSCAFNDGYNYEWCWCGGGKWSYCGKGTDVDIMGRRCLKEYPCGMHRDKCKVANHYFCYLDHLDHKVKWGRCCAPWHPCGKHGYSYDWCYTGLKKKTEWKKCVP